MDSTSPRQRTKPCPRHRHDGGKRIFVGDVISTIAFAAILAAVTTTTKANANAQANANAAEQVHLSYASDPNAMVVSWSTPSKASSTLYYGKSNGSPVLAHEVTGTSEHFKQYLNDSGIFKPCPECVDEYLHVATMSSLEEGARYTYQIGNDTALRFEFTAGREGSTRVGTGKTFAVYGDMGTHLPGSESASPSLKFLQNDVNNGKIDGVLHVGDLAYDLRDNGGQTAALFMRQIQPVAAKVPYMVCPGNHEGGTPFAGSFKHYFHRFNMPGKQDGQRSHNSYYSFDVGPAHIISFSSEAYFWQLWAVAQQFEWLEKDLQAVNRSKTPFVITMAHRPMYCSASDDHDDCTLVNSTMRRGLLSGKNHTHNGLFALEPLFKKYNVDLSFWAHEHSYERLWPTYEGAVMNGTTTPGDPYHNAQAPVHIVAGAAGCREGIGKFQGPRGPWSAVRDSAYGYGRLFLANHTHIHWEQLEDQNGTIIDEFWLRKDAA